MSITAKYPGRCFRCQGRIEPGTQIDFYPPNQAAHATCPPAPEHQPQPKHPDIEEHLELAACTHCGRFWTAPHDRGGLPPRCPTPADHLPPDLGPLGHHTCGGQWER